MLRTLALLVSLFIVPLTVSAFDMGEAMVSCQKSPQFKAGNSTKQCVVLPKNAEGKCRVAVPAIGGGYIESSFIAYECDKKCENRPEEFGWEGGSTAASVNVCHNGCMYSSALDPQGAAGFSYQPTGGVCHTSDAPEPKPVGDGGGDDGGGGGSETGGGDGGGDGGGSDG
ncbi:TPA: hypothetical protein ACOEOK_002119, partial [Stenotrophomonas maltophilia]